MNIPEQVVVVGDREPGAVPAGQEPGERGEARRRLHIRLGGRLRGGAVRSARGNTRQEARQRSQPGRCLYVGLHRRLGSVPCSPS